MTQTTAKPNAQGLVTVLMDPVLIALSGLLVAMLLAFLLGFIPYPVGIFVLAAFIAARVLYLQGPGNN